MSLVYFHIFLITSAVLFSLGFSGWAYTQYQASGQTVDFWTAAGALAGGVVLSVYLAVFVLKNFRKK